MLRGVSRILEAAVMVHGLQVGLSAWSCVSTRLEGTRRVDGFLRLMHWQLECNLEPQNAFKLQVFWQSDAEGCC